MNESFNPEKQNKLAEDFRDVFRRSDRGDTKKAARERFHSFCDKWGKYYSYFSRQKENPRIGLYFTYLGYDYRIRTMIKTTNRIERLNRDFKRTTRMRGALPNPEATLLLLGGVARDVKAYRRKAPLLGKEEKKFQCQKKKQKNMYKFVVNKDRFYTLFGTLLKIIVDLNHRKRCLATNV